MAYAIACKSCGFVEKYAWDLKDDGRGGEPYRVRGTTPLTPRGHAPTYCPKCGTRNWRVPATEEDVSKHEASEARLARAGELCARLNIDGLFKIPDEIKALPEIKNALSNLLAPLDGDVLKHAQANVIKAYHAGIAGSNEILVELYDRAVQKALKGAKAAA